MAQIKEIGIFTIVDSGNVIVDVWYGQGRMNEVIAASFDEAIAALPYAVRRDFTRKGAYRLVKTKFGTRVRGQWWQPTGK